eukprot:TRINITY_DN560_c0_g1_i2.p1 TRINITY_DN560_c0_g1~~TRINITY_DN560_c0_g1_i2.p1  ORF type:complete len:109 (+),score=8.11 TRINITY_DN560_c0_g1_i2:902-1228(+)
MQIAPSRACWEQIQLSENLFQQLPPTYPRRIFPVNTLFLLRQILPLMFEVITHFFNVFCFLVAVPRQMLLTFHHLETCIQAKMTCFNSPKKYNQTDLKYHCGGQGSGG